MFKVCIVEDEKELLDILSIYLINDGWETLLYTDLKSARKNINEDINLWILDIMLNYDSGIELLKEIKKNTPNIPVILMSAKSDSIDRVLGFEIGCDDYIAKPFLPIELVYRARKYFKTNEKLDSLSNKDIDNFMNCEYFSTYKIYRKKRMIYNDDLYINLTSKEYDIMLYFIDNKSIALSREDIIQKIWGYECYFNDRVIDNYIKRIRKKLPNFNIETIYGFGYRCNL